MNLVNLCKTCKFYQHPEWSLLIPGYRICAHPKANGVVRVDVQRMMDDKNHCGREGKWWSPKDDSIGTTATE